MYSDYMNPGADELEQLDREIRHLSDRRKELTRNKPMDPKDERLAELAYEAGASRANYASLRQRHKDAEERIKDLEKTRYNFELMEQDRDNYRARANAAQPTIDKLKARVKKLQAENKELKKPIFIPTGGK